VERAVSCEFTAECDKVSIHDTFTLWNVSSADTLGPGMAIRSFRDRGTEDVFNGVRGSFPPAFNVARRKLEMVHAAVELRDLIAPPGNKLHALSGDRQGQHAIRINDQYRVCFTWKDGDAYEVEITDYH
jgi:toxin HigB-1